MAPTRSHFVLGGSSIAGLVGLAACGAPGGGSREMPAASSTPVTVRWVNDVGTPTNDAFNEQFNRRANERFNGKIKIETEAHPDPDWGKRYEKYTAMALSNTLPHIITLCCTYIRPFMIAGLAAPLDSYIRKDLKPAQIDDFFKGPYDAFKVDGKQLGLPVYLNVNIMFVNRNLLKEAGLAYPSENWSKQQFLEYATKLTRKGERIWGFDMGFTALDRNISFIWNNGGEPHDPKDGPVVTKLTYDDPKTVEGLQFLHDLRWKHQVSPKNNDDRGGTNTADAFLNGKVAIRMDAASSSGSDIFNKAPATGLDWDFFPLPKGPNGHGARVSTDGYMLDKNKTGAESDAAWQVLRELTSAETGIIRATVQRQQPPQKSVQQHFDKGYEGRTAKLARIMAETSRPDPRAFWKDANQVGSMIGKYMGAAFDRNELTVSQAMKQAMDEVRGYYGGK